MPCRPTARISVHVHVGAKRSAVDSRKKSIIALRTGQGDGLVEIVRRGVPVIA